MFAAAFCNNFFRKIHARAMVSVAMATMIMFVRTRGASRLGSGAPGHCTVLLWSYFVQEKIARGGESAQPIEKSRFGQGYQRESKRIPLISFADLCPGLAGFG
jgi:hypothetical protein